MPRRGEPKQDPLARDIGKRVASLRVQAKLTLEQLAVASELSKGHLSDLEHGRIHTTIHTLAKLAEPLKVDLLDLVTFPDDSERQRLVALTRRMKAGSVRHLIRELEDSD
jgi:transcriptional regulator with XRE-family HTH domain